MNQPGLSHLSHSPRCGARTRADAMPILANSGPETLPPPWRSEPRRAEGQPERQLQERGMDRGSDRGAEVVTLARPGFRTKGDRLMSRKTNPAVTSGSVFAPVRVKLKRMGPDYARPYPPDGQAREWWQRLKNALGTSSSHFLDASLQQLIGAARLPGGGISEISVNASLAFIESAKPQDEVECALVIQMACTHSAAMAVLKRLGGGHGPDRSLVAMASAAAKLLRAYSTQVEFSAPSAKRRLPVR